MPRITEEGITNLSAHYYNLGLENARVRNLSVAADYLGRSLEADKTNTEARNLLGLVYYALGETVEALASWVVSLHYQPEDNIADKYLDEVRNDPAKLDAIDQAVKKYNIALDYARDNKLDLAMIQLKKAVSMHPTFVRAMQLLTLLHMMNNEPDKAGALAKRILKTDCTNALALRYLNEIREASSSGKALNASARDMAEESFAATKIEAEVAEEETLDDGPNYMAFIGLVAGILIGVAVVFFLVVPNRDAKIRQEYTDKEKNYSEELNIKLARINSLENQLAQLELENTELSVSLRDALAKLDGKPVENPVYDNSYIELCKATDAYIDYLVDVKTCEKTGAQQNLDILYNAADTLLSVDASLLANEDVLALYNEMCTAVMVNAGAKIYEEGRAAYNYAQYNTTVECMKKAVLYYPRNDYAYYFLGKGYEGLGDKVNAVAAYEALIANCPNSSLVSLAREAVSLLSGR